MLAQEILDRLRTMMTHMIWKRFQGHKLNVRNHPIRMWIKRLMPHLCLEWFPEHWIHLFPVLDIVEVVLMDLTDLLEHSLFQILLPVCQLILFLAEPIAEVYHELWLILRYLRYKLPVVGVRAAT